MYIEIIFEASDLNEVAQQSTEEQAATFSEQEIEEILELTHKV